MLKRPLRILLAIFLILTTVGCNEKRLAENETASPNTQISENNPKIDYETVIEVEICDTALKSYLKAETTEDQYYYLSLHTGENHLNQKLELVSWRGDGGGKYTVTISEKADFSGGYTITTKDASLTDAKILTPGKTYYWKAVGSVSDNILGGGKIYVKDEIVARPITMDGVGNVRDIGGWYTEYGQSVKYGMIYRGRRLDDITADGIDTIENLGLKSELDIRSPSDNPYAVEGTKLNYFYVDTRLQYDRVFDEENKEKLQKCYQSIFEVISNEDNYPIYIHCAHGADRTGTLVFFLNGLLGVCYEDLTRDFEMTSFTNTPGKRWRGTGNGITFLDSDLELKVASNYIAWGKLYKRTLDEFGTENQRLSSAIENFLVNYAEIPQSQIDSFKDIMLP